MGNVDGEVIWPIVGAGAAMMMVCLLIGLYCYKRKRKPRAPGPKPLPLLGNAHQVDPKKVHVTMNHWADKYGDIYHLKMFGTNYLVLSGQDLFDSVLGQYDQRPNSIVNTLIYDGHGVDFSNDDFILAEYVRVVHAVTGDKSMQDLFKTELKACSERLYEKATCGADVQINKPLLRTIIIQMEIFLLGCAPEEKNIDAFLEFTDKFKNVFLGASNVALTAMPWLRLVPGPLKRRYGQCKGAMDDMNEGFMEIIRSGKGNGRGLIENLVARKLELERVNSKDKLTEDNIYGFVIDTLVGSIFPIANNLIGIMLCIVEQPSVQDKIHAELDRLCLNRPPSEEDMDRLQYLRATLLEGLRYLSILSVTVPHTTTKDTDINGYHVDKDTHIFGNMFNLHHSEQIWGDPWTFRPERFLNSSGNLLPSDDPLRKSVKAFGTGPRMCKGYNFAESTLFSYVSTIMYYFRLLPPAEGQLPDSDPRSFGFAAALSVPEVRCRFELRQGKILQLHQKTNVVSETVNP